MSKLNGPYQWQEVPTRGYCIIESDADRKKWADEMSIRAQAWSTSSHAFTEDHTRSEVIELWCLVMHKYIIKRWPDSKCADLLELRRKMHSKREIPTPTNMRNILDATTLGALVDSRKIYDDCVFWVKVIEPMDRQANCMS